MTCDDCGDATLRPRTTADGATLCPPCYDQLLDAWAAEHVDEPAYVTPLGPED